MKLCMFNDCQCGEHEYSLRCCDCPLKDELNTLFGVVTALILTALRDARTRTARVAIG